MVSPLLERSKVRQSNTDRLHKIGYTCLLLHKQGCWSLQKIGKNGKDRGQVGIPGAFNHW
jgi:hypothetical protein